MQYVRGHAGARPSSAEVKSAHKAGSRTSHERYIQTLQDARRKQPAMAKSAEAHSSLHAKAQARAQQQMLEPVQGWSVSQVSDWVAALGLPQYRKNFIHQGVSGLLLLKLNHRLLKANLPPQPDCTFETNVHVLEM